MGLKKEKLKFYSLDNILKCNAQYNMIIGERSNGKTYACLKHGLTNYINTGKQLAIIRRYRDDFTGKRGQTMFDALASDGTVTKLTKGEWTDIYYYSGRWFLCRFDDANKRIIDKKPLAYAFSLASMEHDKSTSYPDITTVVFDEFLTRSQYLPDEFITFTNVLSTIIRQRTDVTIFMLGNTVNKYCPYFKEMGLKGIEKLDKGKIIEYNYGDSGLKVAVEFADSLTKKGKPSDIYFAFNNPKLQMITNGTWEIDMYPHFPIELKELDRQILFKYYIVFDENILECEIMQIRQQLFTYIHTKTTELKYIDDDLIFSTEYSFRNNWKRNIFVYDLPIIKKIHAFYLTNKVFYQDNEVGEIVRNYLNWCKQNKGGV